MAPQIHVQGGKYLGTPGGQVVKILPASAMQWVWVPSLVRGAKDPIPQAPKLKHKTTIL